MGLNEVKTKAPPMAGLRSPESLGYPTLGTDPCGRTNAEPAMAFEGQTGAYDGATQVSVSMDSPYQVHASL